MNVPGDFIFDYFENSIHACAYTYIYLCTPATEIEKVKYEKTKKAFCIYVYTYVQIEKNRKQ